MSTDFATKRRWQNRVRWSVAHHLNRLPCTCWAGLVSWALHSRPLWDRDNGDDVRQDFMCRRDADACGRCYCGKIGRTEPCPRRQCRGRVPHSRLVHSFGWVRR